MGKTSVRQIITYPGSHIAKPVNVQHQIQKVMTQTLASANIERTLFNIETTSGPLSPRLRTKITQAIVGAFEQVYLNESSPVTDKLASIAHNIRTKHSYRSGKIQNIVKDSSRITKVQNLTAKKNERKIHQIRSQVKKNSPKVNVKKMIVKSLPPIELHKIK